MNTDLFLLERFITRHPHHAGLAVESLDNASVAALLSEIPEGLAIALLDSMHAYKAAGCLKETDIDLAVELLSDLAMPRVELILRHADQEFREQALQRLPKGLAVLMGAKLAFPAHSVGALMSPVVTLLRNDMTVKEATKLIKSASEQAPNILCVVNKDGALAGVVRLNDLLLAGESQEISSLLQVDVTRFSGEMPIDSVVEHPAWYNFSAIPVVDSLDKPIGILSFEETQQKRDKKAGDIEKQIVQTSSALGELYRIGLTAFLHSIGK